MDGIYYTEQTQTCRRQTYDCQGAEGVVEGRIESLRLADAN